MDVPEKISFEHVADPTCVTLEDVARWASELSQYILDNPNSPDDWLAKCLLLYRRLEAAKVIMKSLTPASCAEDER